MSKDGIEDGSKFNSGTLFLLKTFLFTTNLIFFTIDSGERCHAGWLITFQIILRPAKPCRRSSDEMMKNG